MQNCNDVPVCYHQDINTLFFYIMRKKSGELGEIPSTKNGGESTEVKKTRERGEIAGMKKKRGIKGGSTHDKILDKIAQGEQLSAEDREKLGPLIPKKKEAAPPTLTDEVSDAIEEIRAKLPKRKTTKLTEPTTTIDTEIVEPEESKPTGFLARIKGLFSGK